MNNKKLFGALVFAAAMVGCAGVDDGGGEATPKIPNGTVVAVSRELFIAVSRDSGATFTKIMHEPGLPEEQSLLVRASYVNGRFFLFGWRLFTSTDAVTFSELKAPFEGWFGEVAYGNGIYLTGGGYGLVMTSPDGLTWTMATQVPDVPLSGIRSVAAGDNKFAMATADGKVFVTADNGQSWAADPLKTTNVAFCDGAFQDGAKCKKADVAKSVWAGHGYLFRGEWPTSLKRSGDGITFTDVGIIAPRDLAFAPPM